MNKSVIFLGVEYLLSDGFPAVTTDISFQIGAGCFMNPAFLIYTKGVKEEAELGPSRNKGCSPDLHPQFAQLALTLFRVS